MKLKLLTAVRHPILKFERLTNTPPGSGVINAVFFLSVTFLCFQIAESVRIHDNAARLYRLARDQIPAACIFLTSVFIVIGEPIAMLILGNGLSFPGFDPTSTDINVLGDTVCWILFAIGTVTAAIFGALGLKEHKNKK